MHKQSRNLCLLCRSIVIPLAIGLLLGILPQNVHGKRPLTGDIEWESILLAADWPDAVLRLPPRAEKNLAPQVFRLIRAHALLARNRNNESLCLFLSASSPEDLEVWERWTRELMARQPTSAVACYLRGDALARLQEWDHAIETFTSGLSIEPDNACLLNARGVVHALQNNWDAALMDFVRANRAAPDFADAHASQGFMWVQKRDGAKGALDAFNQALDKSRKDFALAHYGRGCVLAASGDWQPSAEDLKTAVARSSCAKDLIGSRLASMFQKIAAKEREWLEGNEGKKAGTEIERTFMDNMSAIRNGSFGGWNGPLNQNIKLMRDNPHLMATWNEETQDLSPIVNQNLQATMLQRGRGVNDWWSQVKDLTVSVTAGVNRKDGAKLEGTIESGGVNWADHKLKFGDAPTWSRARELLPPVPSMKSPGGFSSAPVQAAWDDGEWPFEPLYGLLYRAKPALDATGQ